jgi:chromosome partitioning protein
MLVQASKVRRESAHVVVLGNEKGGAGKSTLAMHVAVALMNFGQRVATIDLDLRQKSFTQYIENRRVWAKHAGCALALPEHYCVARGLTQRLDDNEAIEFTGFVDALTAVEQTHDFIVVDTAGSDTHLTRLAHSMADTLITPLNDSFVDFAVLGTIDPRPTASRARATTPRWCARRGPSGDWPTACRWTGWSCATGCRCWIRATSSASSKA